MIRYIQHKEIDYQKWDSYIDKALNGNIYAYSWYLNSACEHWDALIEDDYLSVMPLPFRKKMGISYVFPPSMTQQLGIFSQEIITESKVQGFISSIPAKFKYCEINLNHQNPFQNEKHKLTTHTNLVLDLNRPYPELLSGFSENTRRNIRKSELIDIRISENGDFKNVIQIFKNTKAAELKSLPDDYYRVVERTSHQLLERHQAQVWEASINGDVCAGVIFAFSRNRTYFLFSAANNIAKENNIMHNLVNKFIKENEGKNLVLDFEGSDNKNLARFYKSFGATEKNYRKIIINNLPGVIFSIAQILGKK
jgi:hypothetical protein